MEKLSFAEIRNEYKKTEENWLKLHFKTSFGLVVFIFIIECIMGYLLYKIGEIHTTIPRYIFKYLLWPMVSNLVFIIMGYWVVYVSKLKQKIKIYMISLFFVGICFTIFSVHSIFPSLYMIFTIPILFTVVYGDYSLTTVIASFSVFSKFFSEIFIKWDCDKVNILNNNIELVNFIISIFFLIAFYAVSIVVIFFERCKNAASIDKELERYRLKYKINNDELTSISNRNALQKAFVEIRNDKDGNQYIFAIIDIDNFKKLNDTLGHYKGDLVLFKLGNILKSSCKDSMPFRFGGDEFCIIFKNTKLKAVIEKCVEIQKKFREVDLDNKINMQLTLSIGIASYSENMTTTKLFENADAALYKAKVKKNTICIYEKNNVLMF